MIRTIQIDDATASAKELLDYLSTLDFVRMEEQTSEVELTPRHMEILTERRNSRLKGETKTFS